ncbi:hypothetical protein CEW46_23935 [Bacillus cereus]|nr:hypothetical protein CEW46_23935 [Bacillus cereus]
MMTLKLAFEREVRYKEEEILEFFNQEFKELRKVHELVKEGKNVSFNSISINGSTITVSYVELVANVEHPNDFDPIPRNEYGVNKSDTLFATPEVKSFKENALDIAHIIVKIPNKAIHTSKIEKELGTISSLEKWIIDGIFQSRNYKFDNYDAHDYFVLAHIIEQKCAMNGQRVESFSFDTLE